MVRELGWAMAKKRAQQMVAWTMMANEEVIVIQLGSRMVHETSTAALSDLLWSRLFPWVVLGMVNAMGHA